MVSTRKYLIDALSTLRPAHDDVPNPFRLLGMLTCDHWKSFILGFLAWTWDAFDYHSVTLSYPDLTQEFDKSLTELTLAVTLTLMTRPIGGIIFGILSDRYGRKLPFIGNCALLIFFVLGTALCRNYASFIAVRALFGIAMGGIYGNAAATALEDCPVEARGLLSGLFQSGYAFGYVLAAAFYEAFHGTSQGWRSMFWFGSAIAVLLIVFRLWVPETQVWRARRRQGNHHPTLRGVGSEVLLVLKHHWLLLSYLVFLLMGLSYSTHGTQDVYPWLLRFKYRYLDEKAAISKVTATQTIANFGGLIGGTTIGYGSQIFGRRFSIIVMMVIAGCLLYPYTFTNGNRIAAAAFFEQFCIQGAFGVIPIHLIELSPAGFRTLIVGTSYQTGVLLASASNTILSKIADYYPVPLDARTGSILSDYDFRIPICAFSGAVFAYVIIMVAIGPEKRGIEMAGEETDDSDADFGVAPGTRATTTQIT